VLDDLDANVHRLQWIGWFILALAAHEPYDNWRARLPTRINDFPIRYIFGEEAMKEKALRRKLPAGRSPDNDIYTNLRPGVMVASKILSLDYSSSDGSPTKRTC